jgi:hypothetical protein
MKRLKKNHFATPDAPGQEPLVSFAHLSLSVALADELSVPPYGFPAGQEEELYETGYLSKFFLRC